MKNIFLKYKIYEEEELNEIIEFNNLVPTDCLKDDNEITVSDSDEGDPIWTFKLVRGFREEPVEFYLEWFDEDYILNCTNATL
jgi:hypothetical protein